MPSEAGYDELRRVFDYLRHVGQIGPKIAGRTSDSQDRNGVVPNGNGNANANGTALPNGDADNDNDQIEICVIDADDLLDNPSGILAAYCRSVGLDYTDAMLSWDTAAEHARAEAAFEKWKGFHEDAIHSGALKARDPVRPFFSSPPPPSLPIFPKRNGTSVTDGLL